MQNKRPCPIEGCITPVDADKLMCLEHWRTVPPTVQREVNSTWRRYRQDPQAYLVARRNAMDEATRRDPNVQGKLL